MARVRLSVTIQEGLMDQIQQEMERQKTDNKSQIVEDMLYYYLENFSPVENEVDKLKTEVTELAEQFDQMQSANDQVEQKIQIISSSLQALIEKVEKQLRKE